MSSRKGKNCNWTQAEPQTLLNSANVLAHAAHRWTDLR